MKQRISPLTDDRGQTLVWVAVGMVVLLGIVALAVDVGHLYAERRHMQNAADAGALEAARAMLRQRHRGGGRRQGSCVHHGK